MDQQWLEAQADRIERVLQDFGVTVQVYAGQVLPQVIVYNLQLARGQRVKALRGLHEELASALGVPGVIINRQATGLITVDVPRVEGREVTFGQVLDMLQHTPECHTAMLGLGHNGIPLLVHFPSPDVAHLLIAGMTGSGKTELLRTILASLVCWGKPQDMRVFIVDPKNRRLSVLRDLAPVDAIYSVAEMPALLDTLLTKMEQRDQGGFSKPHIYLIVDELADAVMVGGPIIEAGLTRVVQRGREAGLHLIATTQRPSAEVVKGLMKANFPLRITGAVNSAIEAGIATGIAQSGAEKLLGRGDMLAIHKGQSTRFLAAITPDEDLARLPTRATTKTVCLDARNEAGEGIINRLRHRLCLPGPGRPKAFNSEAMIQFAMAQLMETGDCTQRALREWHKGQYGADINPPRAVAVIEEAKRRMVMAGLAITFAESPLRRGLLAGSND